jgi:rRNA maturation endonuclease Nob1
MRSLAAIFGRLILCVGVMVTVVGCVIGSLMGQSGASAMGPGTVLIIVGGGIYWVASTKICPQCSKRFRYNAVECKYCGNATKAS